MKDYLNKIIEFYGKNGLCLAAVIERATGKIEVIDENSRNIKVPAKKGLLII